MGRNVQGLENLSHILVGGASAKPVPQNEQENFSPSEEASCSIKSQAATPEAAQPMGEVPGCSAGAVGALGAVPSNSMPNPAWSGDAGFFTPSGELDSTSGWRPSGPTLAEPPRRRSATAAAAGAQAE